VTKSVFPILQRELVQQHDWTTGVQLAIAILHWSNAAARSCYHSFNNGLRPIDYKTAKEATKTEPVVGTGDFRYRSTLRSRTLPEPGLWTPARRSNAPFIV